MTPLYIIGAIIVCTLIGFSILPKILDRFGNVGHIAVGLITITICIISLPLFYLAMGDSFYV